MTREESGIMKVYQKSKAIDNFREKMYEKSDKQVGTISMYEAMTIYNDYLEDISGKWLPKQDGKYIYAQCSKCSEVHDVASNYCPSCGCLMDRNGFNAYIKSEG